MDKRKSGIFGCCLKPYALVGGWSTELTCWRMCRNRRACRELVMWLFCWHTLPAGLRRLLGKLMRIAESDFCENSEHGAAAAGHQQACHDAAEKVARRSGRLLVNWRCSLCRGERVNDGYRGLDPLALAVFGKHAAN